MCAAGAALLTQPMDVVKTKMQAENASAMERVARFIECELRARAATLSSRCGTVHRKVKQFVKEISEDSRMLSNVSQRRDLLL